jgi:hypothetical protein
LCFRSEFVLPIEFLPLNPKESIARLLLTSNELGVYPYDLKMLATTAGPERSLHFKASLGGSQVLTFRFISFAKQKTEYACKIESPDFSVEKTIVAAPGMLAFSDSLVSGA